MISFGRAASLKFLLVLQLSFWTEISHAFTPSASFLSGRGARARAASTPVQVGSRIYLEDSGFSIKPCFRPTLRSTALVAGAFRGKPADQSGLCAAGNSAKAATDTVVGGRPNPNKHVDTGVDPQGFLQAWHTAVLTDDMVRRFYEEGYLVIDGAFDAEEQLMLQAAMEWTMGQFDNEHHESWVGTRDDVVAFVDETAAWLPPPIADAICRIKGCAERLQENHPMCGLWRLRDGKMLEPATDKRPITLSQAVQLASFAPGGEYIIHSDNSMGEIGKGERKNFRSITAIAYAQPQDWSEADEGNLRIWLRSDNIHVGDTPIVETEIMVRQELKAHRKEGEPDEDSTYLVDVQPRAGRLVLFRSTLLHQVCPSKSRARRAIAVWFYTPQEIKEGSQFDGAKKEVAGGEP